MTQNQIPSMYVLAETPMRALNFLSGVARNAGIQHLLATRGWGAADYEQGWSLLHQVAGYSPNGAPQPVAPTVASEAIAGIDAWDEPNFRIASSALRYRFPLQHDFLFAGDLQPARGPESILTVMTFLDRVDALESGKGRDKAARKDDLAAVSLLAKKGIHAEERNRVRTLLEQATQAEGLATAGVVIDDQAKAERVPPEDQGQYEAALRELFYWLDEWTETARVVIKRRDYLIRLGLASPRRAKDGEAPPPPATNGAGGPTPPTAR